MAERNQKVYERVLQELNKNPAMGSRELYAIAQNTDKSVGKDTLQQFHARYYLPAKREQKLVGGEKSARRSRRLRKQGGDEREAGQEAAEPTKRRRPRRFRRDSGSGRDQIRALLLQFAQELTDAESRSSLVQALAKVDSYVDKIEAAGS